MRLLAAGALQPTHHTSRIWAHDTERSWAAAEKHGTMITNTECAAFCNEAKHEKMWKLMRASLCFWQRTPLPLTDLHAPFPRQKTMFMSKRHWVPLPTVHTHVRKCYHTLCSKQQSVWVEKAAFSVQRREKNLKSWSRREATGLCVCGRPSTQCKKQFGLKVERLTDNN